MPGKTTNYGGVNYPSLPSGTGWGKAKWGSLPVTVPEPDPDTPRVTPPTGEQVSPGWGKYRVTPPEPIDMPPQVRQQVEAATGWSLPPQTVRPGSSIPTTTEAPQVASLRAPVPYAAAAPVLGGVNTGVKVLTATAPDIGQMVGHGLQQAGSWLLGLVQGEPENWDATKDEAQNIGQEWAKAKAQGIGGGAMYLANRPLDLLTGPYIVNKLWQASTPQGYGAEVQQYKQEKAKLLNLLTLAQNNQAGTVGWAQQTPEMWRLRDQMYQLDRDFEKNHFGNREYRRAKELGWDLSTGEGFRNYNSYLLNEVWQGIRHGMTSAEKVKSREQYTAEAPMWLQFVTGAIADPLNAFDLLGEVREGRKIAKAMQETTAAGATVGRGAARHVLTVDEVARDSQRLADRANGLVGKRNPFLFTPESLAAKHVEETGNATLRVTEAVQGDADMFRRFIINPDDADVVKATGGYSQSKQAKRSVVLIRKALGEVDAEQIAETGRRLVEAENKVKGLEQRASDLGDKVKTLAAAGKDTTAAQKTADDALKLAQEGRRKFEAARTAAPRLGDIDFATLNKIMVNAKGDDLETVAELARRFDNAARSIYARPVNKVLDTGKTITEFKYGSELSRARKVRGQVSNIVSIMLLGTNPGYAFRNAANNLFTALVDGTNPFQRTDTIRTLWASWGPPPWSTKQGLGARGEVWKTRKNAIEYVKSLSQPMTMGDVFKAIDWKQWYSASLQLGQNIERYSSERIVAHHVKFYWGQVWPKTVRKITEGLIKQGFTPEQVEYLARQLDPCMNPQEVKKVIEDFIAGTSATRPGRIVSTTPVVSPGAVTSPAPVGAPAPGPAAAPAVPPTAPSTASAPSPSAAVPPAPGASAAPAPSASSAPPTSAGVTPVTSPPAGTVGPAAAPPSSAPASFATGTRVSHPIAGDGTVVQVLPPSGSTPERYRIEFDDGSSNVHVGADLTSSSTPAPSSAPAATTPPEAPSLPPVADEPWTHKLGEVRGTLTAASDPNYVVFHGEDGSTTTIEREFVQEINEPRLPEPAPDVPPASVTEVTPPAGIDARKSAPPEVIEEVTRAGGPDAADELREILARNPTPEAAAADLDITLAGLEEQADLYSATERVNEAIQDVQELLAYWTDSFDVAVYTAQVKAAFREFRQIEREYWSAHNARTRATWRAVAGLRWEEADILWQRYWEDTLQYLNGFHDALDHAEEILGHAIGMSDDAIKRGQKYRAFRAQHKAEYADMLAETWARSRAEKNPAARNQIWEDFYTWSDGHYKSLGDAEDLYLEERITDVNEAINDTVAKGRLPNVPPSEPPPPGDTGTRITPRPNESPAPPTQTSQTSVTAQTAPTQPVTPVTPVNADPLPADLDIRATWNARRKMERELTSQGQYKNIGGNDWTDADQARFDEVLREERQRIRDEQDAFPRADVTRSTLTRALVEHFGVTDEEADLAARIWDARARVWSKQTGKPAAQWYAEHIAAIRRGMGESDDILKQEGFVRHVTPTQAYEAQRLELRRLMNDAIDEVPASERVREQVRTALQSVIDDPNTPLDELPRAIPDDPYTPEWAAVRHYADEYVWNRRIAEFFGSRSNIEYPWVHELQARRRLATSGWTVGSDSQGLFVTSPSGNYIARSSYGRQKGTQWQVYRAGDADWFASTKWLHDAQMTALDDAQAKGSLFQALTGYPGNKRTMAAAGAWNGVPIAPGKFERVLDVFGGSGRWSNDFSRKLSVPRVLNDLSADVTNFHTVAQTQGDRLLAVVDRELNALLAIVEQHPAGGEDAYRAATTAWRQLRARLAQGNQVDRAALFLFDNTGSLTIMGKGESQKIIRGAGAREAFTWRFSQRTVDRIKRDLADHSEALKSATITRVDARDMLRSAKKRDLVLLDPPYVDASVRYTKGRELQTMPGALDFINKDMAEANRRGVAMVYTNNANPEIVKALQANGFSTSFVDVPTEGAKTRREVVAWNRAVAPAEGAHAAIHEAQSLLQGAADTARGAVEFLGDGRAIIRALQGGDVSTVLHETGHIFRRDLAQVALSNAAADRDLRTLENWVGIKGHRAEWTVEQEEKFTRAFEEYFREGRAPSKALETVFERFKNWLTHIYQALGGKISNDLNDEVRGVFDRLIADVPDHGTRGDEWSLLPELRPVTAEDISDLKLAYSDYKSAAGAARTWDRTKVEERLATINCAYELAGLPRVDELDVNKITRQQHDAIMEYLSHPQKENDAAIKELRGKRRAAEQGNAVAGADTRKAWSEPTVSEPRPATPADYWNLRTQAPGTPGRTTQAYGIDASKPYNFRYKVVDLDDMLVSHDDAFRPNADFPQHLQPRDRSAQASRSQVDDIVNKFNPDWLLVDHRFIEDGTPIVSKEGVVLAGNGRSLALRYMRDNEPEKLAAYEQMLRERAAEFGIDPDELVAYKHPVLVRELDDAAMTDEDLGKFAREANEKRQLAQNAAEDARSDADRISDARLAYLYVPESGTIDGALMSQANKGLVDEFIESFPVNARGAILDAEGRFSAAGRERLKNALLLKTFNSDTGKHLAEIFINSTDSDVKAIEAAIYGSLGKLAKMEAAIRSGERAAEFSIQSDISDAVDMLARLRQNGFTVAEYLHPVEGTLVNLHESELSTVAEMLLEHLDALKNRTRSLRDFLGGYADDVMDSANLQQMNMFGEVEIPRNKEKILDDLITQQRNELGLEPATVKPTEASDTTLAPGHGEPGMVERTPTGEAPAEPTQPTQPGPPAEVRPQESVTPVTPPASPVDEAGESHEMRLELLPPGFNKETPPESRPKPGTLVFTFQEQDARNYLDGIPGALEDRKLEAQARKDAQYYYLQRYGSDAALPGDPQFGRGNAEAFEEVLTERRTILGPAHESKPLHDAHLENSARLAANERFKLKYPDRVTPGSKGSRKIDEVNYNKLLAEERDKRRLEDERRIADRAKGEQFAPKVDEGPMPPQVAPAQIPTERAGNGPIAQALRKNMEQIQPGERVYVIVQVYGEVGGTEYRAIDPNGYTIATSRELSGSGSIHGKLARRPDKFRDVSPNGLMFIMEQGDNFTWDWYLGEISKTDLLGEPGPALRPQKPVTPVTPERPAEPEAPNAPPTELSDRERRIQQLMEGGVFTREKAEQIVDAADAENAAPRVPESTLPALPDEDLQLTLAGYEDALASLRSFTEGIPESGKARYADEINTLEKEIGKYRAELERRGLQPIPDTYKPPTPPEAPTTGEVPYTQRPIPNTSTEELRHWLDAYEGEAQRLRHELEYMPGGEVAERKRKRLDGLQPEIDRIRNEIERRGESSAPVTPVTPPEPVPAPREEPAPAPKPEVEFPADKDEKPTFKEGDRVQLKNGMHGTVVEVHTTHWQSHELIGGRKLTDSYSHSYRIRTDAGHTELGFPGHIAHEVGKAPPVVPDVTVRDIFNPHGEPYYLEPNRVLDDIARSRREAAAERAAAERARKPENIREHRVRAKDVDRKADGLVEDWNKWAQEYPDEAKRVAGQWETEKGRPAPVPEGMQKPAAPTAAPGAPTAAAGAGASFKTGTGPKGDGIEIRFKDKPTPETISRMKGLGFQSKKDSRGWFWWAKNTDDREQFARELAGKVDQAPPVVPPPAAAPKQAGPFKPGQKVMQANYGEAEVVESDPERTRIRFQDGHETDVHNSTLEPMAEPEKPVTPVTPPTKESLEVKRLKGEIETARRRVDAIDRKENSGKFMTPAELEERKRWQDVLDERRGELADTYIRRGDRVKWIDDTSGDIYTGTVIDPSAPGAITCKADNGPARNVPAEDLTPTGEPRRELPPELAKAAPPAPDQMPERLAALRKLALDSEHNNLGEFWNNTPLGQHPYYDKSKVLGEPFDYKTLKADLEQAGYSSLRDWYDAEVAPHRPKPARVAPPAPKVAPIEDQESRLSVMFGHVRMALQDESLPTDRKALYDWVREFIPNFDPYNEGHIDELYDSLEAALAYQWSIEAQRVGDNVLDQITLAAKYENLLPNRARGVAITALQQFSTPYPLGAAMDAAAKVRPTDIVLEPNGGTGSLIAALRGKAKKIIANELDDRRLALLRLMGFDEVRKGDALMLAVDKVRADVGILNPPWGLYATGRYGTPPHGEFLPRDVAERFFAQAIRTVPDGGRLVALMPTTMLTSPEYLKWLQENHTVRAIIESPANAYVRRGTNVDSVILVVDRGKWPAGEVVRATGPNRPQNWSELADRINEIAPRPQGAQPVGESTNVRPSGSTRPIQPGRSEPSGPRSPDGGLGQADGTVGGRPAGRDGSAGMVPANQSVDGRDADAGPTPGMAGQADTGSDAGIGERVPGPEQPEPQHSTVDLSKPVTVTAESDAARAERVARELAEQHAAAGDSKHFTIYQTRTGERVSPHPRLVVETQTLAGAPYPELTYRPHRSVRVALERGDISDEQFDVICAVGQANEAGHGILIADDVGVGKSREIAGAVLDLFQRGKANRVLLSTKSGDNVEGLIEELKVVMGDQFESYRIVRVTDFKEAKKVGGTLPLFDKAIYLVDSHNFTQYEKALKAIEFQAWFADEAHAYKNIDGANIGRAWRDLHIEMMRKNARINYFTATPAVDAEDLAYLYGLREWTPDPGGFYTFQRRIRGAEEEAKDAARNIDAEIDAALNRFDHSDSTEVSDVQRQQAQQRRQDRSRWGSSMSASEMEQLMRELKRKGKYISRDLWRGGVEFNIRELALTPEQIQGQDEVVGVMRKIYDTWHRYSTRNAATRHKDFGPMGFLQAETKRRYFDMRLDGILRDADDALSRGEQVVIYVESVNPQEVGKGGLGAALNTINTWDVTKMPNGELSDPTAIPEALIELEGLRDLVNELPALRDPIKTIEDYFGKQNVGFVIGDVTKQQRQAMMKDFQNGKRRVMVISQAGTTGINLHDIGTGRRHLFVADYTWQADNFKQLLGRVDRSGQRSSPIIDVYHTGSAAERKFVATIANRMQSLGAISKGAAGSAGADELGIFEIGGDIGREAMLNAWGHLDHETRLNFMAPKFIEYRQNLPPLPVASPISAEVKQFLLELQVMPYAAAKKVEEAFVRAYEEVARGMAAAEADHTAKIRGEVLRSTELKRDLTLHEVQNEDGEIMGILEGVIKLTPTGEPSRIRRVSNIIQKPDEVPPGAEPQVTTLKPIHYMSFRDNKSGKYVSGLVVPRRDVRAVAEEFGKNAGQVHTVDSALNDLRAGDRIRLIGARNLKYELRLRPSDKKIAVEGAKLADRDALMGAGAVYSATGSFFFVPHENLTRFLERFPIDEIAPGGGGPDVLHQAAAPGPAAVPPPGTAAPAAAAATGQAPAAPAPATPSVAVGHSAGSTPLSRADILRNSLPGLRSAFGKMKMHLGGAPAVLPPVTPDQARILRELAKDQLIPTMVQRKAMVSNLATDARNFALLDYSQKRNIHEWLAYVMPWSYWYAGTFPNWARRLAAHPNWVSNYARYKALLKKTNQEYYRAVVGDPNAEMPEYWEDQIRVPFFGTDLWLDLERTLLPVQALINDFKSRTRDEAPGPLGIGKGAWVQQLQEWGPSFLPPLIWAYAAWLSANGYQDAADEWVGYIFPWSRALKSATALAREAVPGLQGVIPPGGLAPEQIINNHVAGGDIWERRRIGYALYQMYKNQEISPEEFRDAAYKQTGEAWDKARQRESVSKAPSNLTSWGFGQGFKQRTTSDIELDRMWNEWGKVWDARSAGGDWQAMLDTFDQKFPWAREVMMAREPDQVKRLKDYGYNLLNQLPPGQQRSKLLADAGLDEALVDRFYAAKGDTTGWPEYETKALAAGFEKLAAQTKVPTEAQTAEYSAAKTDKARIDAIAAAAAGMTVEAWKSLNDAYWQQPEGAPRKAFLLAHPELKQGWNAADPEKKGSTLYQSYYAKADEKTTGTDRPVEVTPAMQKIAETDVEYENQAKRRFGPDILDINAEYGGMSKAERAAFKKQYPDEYKRLLAFYDWRDTFKAANPEWAASKWPNDAKSANSASKGSSSYGGSSSYSSSYYPRRSYSSGGGYSRGGGGGYARAGGSTPVTPVTPPAPPAPEAYETWDMKTFSSAVSGERAEDPAFDTLVSVMFGGDVLNLANIYYGMSADERAEWTRVNPHLWARLLRFLQWLMKQVGVKSDYKTMLASIPGNGNVPTAPPVPGTVPTAPPVPAPAAPPIP